jgi:uncharacterized membrane protein
MSLRDFLLFVHIFGAFLIVAGVGSSTMLGLRASSTPRTRVIALAAELQYQSAMFVILPGALIAIVFGTWLARESGFSFDAKWISFAYTLWFVLTGLSTGALGPHARRIHARAEQLIAGGVEERDELRRAYATPRIRAYAAILVLVVVGFLALMVFKPGA